MICNKTELHVYVATTTLFLSLCTQVMHLSLLKKASPYGIDKSCVHTHCKLLLSHREVFMLGAIS